MTDSPAPRLRCGVAGVGSLGQHHARIYHSLPQTELAGIFEADDARASQICAQYGCRRFASLAEMADACEAVSVVVPTDRHCEVALPLVEKGCDLLIEKPLCVSIGEAERILLAAQHAGCVVQVGHIEHFNPVMTYLEEQVSRPRFITADRLAPFQPRGTEVSVVLDLMIHDIGIVLQLVRSALVRIDAVGVSVLSPTEDIANARLTFANGCVANLNASRISQKKLREIRVFQQAGYLSLDFMNQAGHLIRITPNGMLKEDIPIEKGEPLALELASFADAVRRRREPKVGAVLAKSSLEVAIAIIEQIRQNPA